MSIYYATNNQTPCPLNKMLKKKQRLQLENKKKPKYEVVCPSIQEPQIEVEPAVPDLDL